MADKNIHAHMNLKISLAEAFASDGAFHATARTLRELADDLERHARDLDRQMDRELGDANANEKKGGA